MAKEVIIDMERFRLGLYALDDTTKAPFGSARLMNNCQVTDRGGISPRPGTKVLGTYSSSSSRTGGFFNYRKSFDQDEILVRTYGTVMEAYSLNKTTDWFKFRTGLNNGKEFGFVTSLINTDAEDYLVGGNRYDDFFRWRGSVTLLNGALAGGELAVTVDSVLSNEIFESQTATANSATTVDQTGATWAASQWVNFYVYFPGTGKIRKITANTATQLTFDTLGGAPGNVAFQIRHLNYPATGSIMYNGSTVAYTGIDTATSFTVVAAVAAADRTPVAIVTDTYPANPRGNRFTNFLNRIVVGQVRSALARDSGGALQGYSSGGSVYVSKLNTPTDFTFSAARVAGEGDIIAFPYGGGEITDVMANEEEVIIAKKRYLASIKYSQDTSDLLTVTPIKPGTGSIGPMIRGADDIYLITEDKKFTSIGRQKLKDIKIQSENIGYSIKRFLDACGFDTLGRGIEHKDKVYIPLKRTTASSTNDAILVYNKMNKSFDGVWDISAFGLERWNNLLYYAESTGINVYQMLTGTADVVGSTRYPIVSEYATHFMNLTPSKTNLQAIHSFSVEGYIRGGTTINFYSWAEFASEAFVSFRLTTGTTDEPFFDNTSLSAALGTNPLAVDPMGSIFSDPDADGRRHFFFRVFFPYKYARFFSLGHTSTGADDDYEITRYGLGVKEEVSFSASKIKSTN